MLGLDSVALSGLMMLASVECTADIKPQIHIQPRTQDIQYEFRYTSEELTRLKASSMGAQALGADMVTGGLREDEPKIGVNVSWKVQEYTHKDAACIWYDKIHVTIDLAPKIYIAKDFNYSPCRKEIIEHEKDHVRVDRKIFNKYSQKMARSVENAVRKMNVNGPYRKDQIPMVQEKMAKYIQNSVMAQVDGINKDMKVLQAKIDSPQEYARITKICHAAKHKR